MPRPRMKVPPVPEKYRHKLEGKYGAQCRWYWRNRAKQIAAKKKWTLANPGYFKEWTRKNAKRVSAYRRKQTLRLYKMTQEQYDAQLKKQKGVCAFPGCKATEFKKGVGDSLAVDHCHKTKKNRGLLCYRHNILIGLACDSVKELERAIRYLKRYPT